MKLIPVRVASCFLKIAMLPLILGVGSASAQEYTIGDWHSQINTDPFTDEKMVVSGIAIENGLMILFQCKGSVLAAIIKGHTPIVSMEFITMEKNSEVLWRVDENPMHQEVWTVGGGKAGADYFLINLDGSKMAAAIRDASSKLVFRAHGLTGTVSTDGAPEHMNNVLTGCF